MERINKVSGESFIPYVSTEKSSLFDLLKPYLDTGREANIVYKNGSNAKDSADEVNNQKTVAKEGYQAGNKKVVLFALLEIGQALPAAILAASAAYVGAMKLFGIQGSFQPNLKLLPLIQTGSLALSLVYCNRESSIFLAKWDRSKSLEEQLQYLEGTLGSGSVSKKEAEIATSPKFIERLVKVLDEKDGFTGDTLEKTLDELHGKAERQVLLNRFDLTSTGSLIIGSFIEMTAPQFGSIAAALSALPALIKRTKDVLPEVKEAVEEKPERWSANEAAVMKQRKVNLYRADLALFATFFASQVLGATHIEKLVAFGGLLGAADATLGIGRTMYSMEVDRMLFDRKAMKDKEADPVENGVKAVKGCGNSAWTWIKSKVSRE